MNPLTKDDIKKYAEKYTDFGFEMKVLQAFNNLGFDTEHAGTYTDPISQKNREFDIRAEKILKVGTTRSVVKLAVECKNIDASFPLVVQSVLRNQNEAFHEIIHYMSNGHQPSVARQIVHSAYQVGDGLWVAKSFDQVGLKNNEPISNDGKTFDKMTQALNSAGTLVEQCTPRLRETDIRYMIVPVLVIPDGRLWQIRYDHDGKLSGEPEQKDNAQYYVNRRWPLEINGIFTEYSISHLEIVTYSGIQELVNRLALEEPSCMVHFQMN